MSPQIMILAGVMVTFVVCIPMPSIIERSLVDRTPAARCFVTCGNNTCEVFGGSDHANARPLYVQWDAVSSLPLDFFGYTENTRRGTTVVPELQAAGLCPSEPAPDQTSCEIQVRWTSSKYSHFYLYTLRTSEGRYLAQSSRPEVALGDADAFRRTGQCANRLLATPPTSRDHPTISRE